MEVIRIGMRVVNLAAVASIDLDYDLYDNAERRGVLIRFIGPGGEQARDMFFEGDEARVVRYQFTSQTRDLMSEHARQRNDVQTNKAAGQGG